MPTNSVKNKKIAVYLPSFLGGGAERIMVELANGFAENGFSVDIVVSNPVGPYSKIVSAQVRVVDLKQKRVLLSLPKLIRYLRLHRPDAFLSALDYANVVVIIAKMLSLTSTRVVISERSTASASTSAASGIKARVMPYLIKFVYPRADKIVAVSNGVADDLTENFGLPPEKTTVIYNPINVEEIVRQSLEPVAHKWLSERTVPVILGVGRLHPAKDFHTLIKAFAILRRIRSAKLIILGEGSERSALESLIVDLGLERDIHLPGFVENPYSWMSRASVFVLSSAWEGLPGTLLQAMACGTPVIATDCKSGPAEILDSGIWGRLVPVGNAQLMAEAIDLTLSNHSQPDVQARAKHFRRDSAINGYLDVLTRSV